jgi:trk system potassium uptake protein TrkA
MQKVGVDVVLSPRVMTAEVILRQVHQGKFTMLSLLEGGKANALEISVSKKSRILRKKLRDIKFPQNCLVGAVLRGDEVIVPHGETILEQNDKVVIFTLPDSVNKIEKYF